MLEQAKTKLEMSMAAMKKEHRRELRYLNSKYLKKKAYETFGKACNVFGKRQILASGLARPRGAAMHKNN